MKKRIIHIDDHLLFAEGVKLMFENHSNYQLENHFNNFTTAFTYCKSNMPDLILIDYFLPEGNGLDAAEIFLKLKPKPRIMFLTMVNDYFIMQTAKTRGVNGFLSKNIAQNELFSAIETVFKGQICFPGTESNIEKSNDKLMHLSNREKQIAKLVAQGYSTAKIANALFISELTVSTHRKNILRKLNLENSVQLGNYLHLFN
jgi:DNA-binding NarL/FixJ family response regulator